MTVDTALERQGHELGELKAKLAWFEAQWRLAQAKRFGAGSEQIPGQVRLFDEAEAEADGAAAKETITYRRKKPGRRALPKDLPREQRLHNLPEAKRVCSGCGGGCIASARSAARSWSSSRRSSKSSSTSA